MNVECNILIKTILLWNNNIMTKKSIKSTTSQHQHHHHHPRRHYETFWRVNNVHENFFLKIFHMKIFIIQVFWYVVWMYGKKWILHIFYGWTWKIQFNIWKSFFLSVRVILKAHMYKCIIRRKSSIFLQSTLTHVILYNINLLT
jgi:hypothetical protein